MMLSKKYRSILWLALLLASSIAIAAMGQDWTRWRGPNGDGVVVGFTPPARLPDQLRSKWKTNVGIGFSSPVVFGNRVFVHSRQGESEVVGAYELESGKT